MKRKIMKKTMLTLCLLPAMAFAVTDAQKEAAMKANIQALEAQGLITPGSGVQVIPRASMHKTEAQENKFHLESQQLKNDGYINERSERAYELLHFKEVIKQNEMIEAQMHTPDEIHLRHAPEEIQFAYTYYGVPKNEITEFIGIAPTGTYVKKPHIGWSGAVSFFKTSFGTCAYTEDNLNISHGAPRIAEEDAQYDINGKITLVDVQGNENSGFLYHINWFDKNFIHDLECANEHFFKEITKDTMMLAKHIDKHVDK